MPLLALDLEGTLVSNAVSCFPRPGLYEFMAWCLATFERVVLFTCVDARHARAVIVALAERCEIPPETPARLEVLDWPAGDVDFKDLRLIPGAVVDDSFLVDDNEGFIAEDQKARWIEIAEWERPYPQDDRELARVRRVLERRLAKAGFLR
jgi:hypothetical protein